MSITLTEHHSDEQKAEFAEIGGGGKKISEGTKADPECRFKRLKCELALMQLHRRG